MENWMGGCIHGLLSISFIPEPILNVPFGEKDVLPMSILLWACATGAIWIVSCFHGAGLSCGHIVRM